MLNQATAWTPNRESVDKPGSLPITYRFGRFMLDATYRTLFSGIESRALPEKLFQVLVLLLEADGTTVRKDTFFSRVWPEGLVTDSNLTQHIFMLRQILDDAGCNASCIATVSKNGYRLATPVEKKVGLTMKGTCERCGTFLAQEADDAWICSYECTFCAVCAQRLGSTCPNCGGLLVRRPSRRVLSSA